MRFYDKISVFRNPLKEFQCFTRFLTKIVFFFVIPWRNLCFSLYPSMKFAFSPSSFNKIHIFHNPLMKFAFLMQCFNQNCIFLAILWRSFWAFFPILWLISHFSHNSLKRRGGGGDMCVSWFFHENNIFLTILWQNLIFFCKRLTKIFSSDCMSEFTISFESAGALISVAASHTFCHWAPQYTFLFNSWVLSFWPVQKIVTSMLPECSQK